MSGVRSHPTMESATWCRTLPDAASVGRTAAFVGQVEEILKMEPAIADYSSIVGLNFIDPGHRSGIRTESRYETPLPMILGTEGAGIVEAVGPNVAGYAVGQGIRKVKNSFRPNNSIGS